MQRTRRWRSGWQSSVSGAGSLIWSVGRKSLTPTKSCVSQNISLVASAPRYRPPPSQPTEPGCSSLYRTRASPPFGSWPTSATRVCAHRTARALVGASCHLSSASRALYLLTLLCRRAVSALMVLTFQRSGRMPNHRAALDAGRAIWLHVGRYWPGASERGC